MEPQCLGFIWLHHLLLGGDLNREKDHTQLHVCHGEVMSNSLVIPYIILHVMEILSCDLAPKMKDGVGIVIPASALDLDQVLFPQDVKGLSVRCCKALESKSVRSATDAMPSVCSCRTVS